MDNGNKTPPKIDTQELRELHREWCGKKTSCYDCGHRASECLGDRFSCFVLWIEDRQNEKQA